VGAKPQRETIELYDEMLDETIVEAARQGDDSAQEFLINKYKNFVRAKARSYFLIGADREDIIQEGMIGLYKAIRDFRNDKLASLKGKKTFGGGLDFIGADLRKKNLRGANLSGSCLIAADLRGADLSFVDLIGADLRDADLRGANLSNSIYLTQAQINLAKGDNTTKLPQLLTKPVNW
jgi:uncharacterized protein YjbI with pentapeptide repeats